MVTNVNDAADRHGDDQRHGDENQTLTASNTLADADGLGAFSYQWLRDGVDIAGATGATYTLGDADVGHAIAWWRATPTAMARPRAWPVRRPAAVANVNDAPTGTVTISGTAQEDQMLTASNTLADADGLGAFSYQWQRDGVNIGGATGSHLHAGRCRCRPRHRRGGELHRRPRHAESVTSAATAVGDQRQRRADRHGDDQRHGATRTRR